LEVLLYHQDRYEEEEQLQEEVVLFFWMPASSLPSLLPSAATSASHVHPHTNRLMTTFASVFYRIRNDVMTASLERQLVAGGSLLNRFAR